MSVSSKSLFSDQEYKDRLQALRQAVERRTLDAMVISSPESIYYLSGYETLGIFSFQILIVPLQGEPRFVIRYGERSNVLGRSWLQGMDLYGETEDPIALAAATLRKMRLRRVGLEMKSWFLPADTFRRLYDAASDIAFEDASGAVELLRVTKSAEEIRYVETAARVSSAAVKAGFHAIPNSKTDNDIAAAVYAAMIQAGGDYTALPILLTVGPQTELAHATWCGQPVGEGDAIYLEIPGTFRRYMAPIARTASRGKPPQYITDRYKVATESLERGISAMRPGAKYGDVYEAFVAPFTEAGYEQPVGPGYSVGITFPPSWPDRIGWWPDQAFQLMRSNDTVLKEGMVFHTPRTVRIPGSQSVIISETVLITKTGARVLTDAPREFEQH